MPDQERHGELCWMNTHTNSEEISSKWFEPTAPDPCKPSLILKYVNWTSRITVLTRHVRQAMHAGGALANVSPMANANTSKLNL